MTQAWDFVSCDVLWQRVMGSYYTTVDSVEWPVTTRTRILGACRHHRIYTLGELAALGRWRILNLPNLGNRCYKDIERLLYDYGIRMEGSRYDG